MSRKQKSKIRLLDLSRRNLTKLPDLSKYTSLEQLDCGENQLTTLGVLPATLKRLNCFYNKLTELDNLPENLIYLDCSYNPITTLDSLPPKLEKLICYCNSLTSLDFLPPTLEDLFCDCNYFQYNFKPTLENIRNHVATKTEYVMK